MLEPTRLGSIRARIAPSGLTAQEDEVSFNVTAEPGASDSEAIIHDIYPKGVEANVVEAGLIRDSILSVLKGSEQLFELEYRCERDRYLAWYIVTVTPLQLASGGLVISQANITRHIERLRQYRNSEDDYGALIENALEILEILNSYWNVLYVNQALERAPGYAPENLIRGLILDRIHPRNRNRIRRMLRQLQEEPDLRRRAEFRIRDAFGRWRCPGLRIRTRPRLNCRVTVDVPIGHL